MPKSLLQKLEILADAAKYDASCASSGGARRTARDGGIGSTTGAGICHAYTPDGRCVSLLKILLTNFCRYDCAYCVSRRSSNVERLLVSDGRGGRAAHARSLPAQLHRGIVPVVRHRSQRGRHHGRLVRLAKALRTEHGFRGYIHLKTIPAASPHSDPRRGPLRRPPLDECSAPKRDVACRLCTGEKRDRHQERAGGDARPDRERNGFTPGGGRHDRTRRPAAVAPAGQFTQAHRRRGPHRRHRRSSAASASLYASYRLSASTTRPSARPAIHPRNFPQVATPLLREHRLYQANWSTWFYGFSLHDLAVAAPSGMLSADIDPKLAWALEHRAQFPVDINRAGREMLLRVPGLGVRAVDRIIAARRSGALRIDDLARLSGALARTRPFIVTLDWHPGVLLDDAHLRRKLARKPLQLTLFG